MAVIMIIDSWTAAAIAEVTGTPAGGEFMVVDRLPEPPDIQDCRDVIVDDELKPSMNFYQTKMHRRKKGGKVRAEKDFDALPSIASLR